MKLKSLLLLLAACWWSPPAVRGQIVNVLPELRDLEEGFSGSLAGALDLKAGNSELFVVGGDLLLGYHSERNLVFLSAGGALGVSGGEEVVAQSFEHLRFRRQLRSRLWSELFVQHGFDRFQRLSLRILGGGGLRVRLTGEADEGLHLGSAYMIESERLREGDEADAGEESLHHRWSSYLAGRFELGENASLGATTFVQPRFDDFGDLRLLSQLSLSFPITGHLSFATSFSLRVDSRPSVGVEKTDLSLQSGVELSF